MGLMDLAQDLGEYMIPKPVEKAVGAAQTLYHLGASGWDYATGDSKHGKEHLGEAGLGVLGLIPGVGDLVHAGKTMKDAGDVMGVGHGPDEAPAPDEAFDWAGFGAGMGTVAALPFGPLAWLGGAAVGGTLGALATPSLKGALPASFASEAAYTMLHPEGRPPPEEEVPVCLPGKPEPGPFDHYAD